MAVFPQDESGARDHGPGCFPGSAPRRMETWFLAPDRDRSDGRARCGDAVPWWLVRCNCHRADRSERRDHRGAPPQLGTENPARRCRGGILAEMRIAGVAVRKRHRNTRRPIDDGLLVRIRPRPQKRTGPRRHAPAAVRRSTRPSQGNFDADDRGATLHACVTAGNMLEQIVVCPR